MSKLVIVAFISLKKCKFINLFDIEFGFTKTWIFLLPGLQTYLLLYP